MKRYYDYSPLTQSMPRTNIETTITVSVIIIRMLSALILLLPVALAIDCPEGWMGIHGSCYLVIIVKL